MIGQVVESTDYFKFTLTERSWVIIDEFHNYAPPYYGWRSDLMVYYNASMTRRVDNSYQEGERIDYTNNIRTAFYLDSGTYYFTLKADFTNTAYGYVLPVSNVISKKLTTQSNGTKKLSVSFTPSRGMTRLIADTSSVTQINSTSVWGSSNSTVLTKNTYVFTENGKYSVRAEFLEDEWKNYPVDFNLTVTGILKKQTIQTGASSYQKVHGDKAFSLKTKVSGKAACTYSTSDKKVATVSSKGVVTIKGPGKATITIKSAKTSAYAAATKKITVTVKPKKVTGCKLTAGKKSLRVSWKKIKEAKGYQIQYSLSSKFSSKTTVTIKSGSTVSKDIKKLKSGKKYYVRIRAYVKYSGKTIYGNWSAKKSIKVK